jgi:hypothetical protein
VNRDQFEGPFPLTLTVQDPETGHSKDVKVTFRGP